MPVACEDDFRDLVIVVVVARPLAEDSPRAVGGVAVARARGRAGGRAAVGDVQNTEVLRDEREQARGGALERLVEAVLAARKGLVHHA